ncbi:unnamed protein product [Schistosoma rodhaini]|uniref:PDZ domain-containing protein n=1 Tax=Schistosoma rodhaini TaxID=6188 RepID=A0AA85FH67_9TREM|nr:unnamed protein product [Schistosoma rodhaini]
MNDLKDIDGITEHFQGTTTLTTTFEGDQIDSVEDYIFDKTQMEQNRQSSPFIEHDIDEGAQTVDEEEEEVVEDYVHHDYARDSNNIKNDKQVFQEKMKDILQEMKMKEIIRDKNVSTNLKQSNPYAMNNRPLTPESIDQTFDHSCDDSYIKDEEVIEEEIQVGEVIDKENKITMRVDDRESSVQYEFEPEPENDKFIETQTQMKNDEFQYEGPLSENVTYRSEDPDSQGRLIYNEVPAMNSKTNDIVNFVQEHVQTLKLTEEPQANVEYSEQSKHCHIPTFYNEAIVDHADRTLPNSSISSTMTVIETSSQNSSNSRSRPIRPIYQSSVTLSNHNQSTPHNSKSVMHYPVRRTYSPREEPTSPTRTAIHIGSQVISEQSGPSFTIFLRRPNSERHWGFSFYGGAEYGCPPFVNKVTSNGLANQAGIEVGDVIVSICNSLTVGKTYEQVKAEILRAGNELDLILIRQGVDLNKVAQIAPHIMTTSSFGHQSSFDSDSNNQRKISTRSLTRGRSFRPIQTKSFRILEQQLSISESTGNPIVKPRQNVHELRIVTSPSYSTTFTKPYGQNMNSQGFITDVQNKPQQIHHVTKSTTFIHPKSNQNYNQTQSSSYDYSHTASNVSPSRWVTTQPIRISNTMNTNNMNNGNYQSYQRTENVNWINATPSNLHSQNDLYNQTTYITNSYIEHRDTSSTRSVPIYPTSYSPYRQF